MRNRLIDVSLLVGLVAVAGGIMWTLFNLGGTPRPAPTPAGPRTPTVVEGAPAEDVGRVVPIAPGAAATTTAPPAGTAAGTEPPATPEAATPATPAGATSRPAEGAPPPAPAPVPTPTAEVPAGTVSLDRVGFSYVTGGPGACGVVLEAWTHVAVSRDLLAAYGCGARVRVTLTDAAGGRSEFEGVVGDTMNPQFARTVNVYVATSEPALEYGITTGSITPVE